MVSSRSFGTRFRPAPSALLLLVALGSKARAESYGTVRQPVVFGTPASDSEYPAVGALVRADADSARFVCTGTLIAPGLVLTAAHCFGGTSGPPLRFTLGTDPLAPVRSVPVSRTRSHPDFAISGSTDVEHDIAVAELAYVVTGVAPPPLSESAPRLEDPVALVGYGGTSKGDATRSKNAAVSFIGEVTDSELVIGRAGAVENCTGDSGGPSLATGEDGELRVVGVVSRGVRADTPCSGGSVHTRVDRHLDFIDETRAFFEDRGDSAGGCSVRRTARRTHFESLAVALCSLWLGRFSRRRCRSETP